MGAGILQLVTIDIHNLYITQNPQITFFKSVYRRHTNFSIETIPQFFTQKPDFGKKVTCNISKSGDLISKIYVVIVLPKINQILTKNNELDFITKMAWVNKIGFAIIKTCEIEIGGQIIDYQYGEWLNIWHELTGSDDIQYLQMVGIHPNFNEFTSDKQQLTLYVPLQFWFCKYRSLALPILNLEYTEVKINIDFNNIEQCLNFSPTHSIKLHSDLVGYTQNEYISQVIGNYSAFGIFKHFDILTKTLYYQKLSLNSFVSLNYSDNIVSETHLNQIIAQNQKYMISGDTSHFTAMPLINSNEIRHSFLKPRNVTIHNSYLLVDYIYLDNDERNQFSQSKHEYLIEQINMSTEQQINTINRKISIGMKYPVKLMAFMLQQSFMHNINDHFNYTNSYKHNNYEYCGSNLIKKANIMLNSQERLSFRDSDYYNLIQPYQYFDKNTDPGINIYSFCLFPEIYQPSGTCNMSKIDNISIQIKTDPIIGFNNDAKFKVFYINYNILRILNGLANLVFTD